MKKYNLGVVIGRFEPFHNGHYELIKNALVNSEHVLVLIGSAYRPRSAKNPWTASERATMIKASFQNEEERIHVEYIRDSLYDESRWLANIQTAVKTTAIKLAITENICVFGRDKDSSSYYLKSFPQWHLFNTKGADTLSATELRNHYFIGNSTGSDLIIKANVPPPVWDFLSSFKLFSAGYKNVSEEAVYIENYKKSWASAPFPPTFVTVDAVIVAGGHVLLIKRAEKNGRGLWALPGGFLNVDETIVDGMIRELKEETRIKVPGAVLKGSIVSRQVFDHPNRSLRGRTITHAFKIELNEKSLPAVRSGSDASGAEWVPISEALGLSEHLFEDHFDIIEHFLG
jgi:bifunctional NMN adenylyltransferase/nudix hydrolase